MPDTTQSFAVDAVGENPAIPEPYLIGGKVLFHHKEGVLKSDSTEELIRLQRPASRCLKLLLDKRYELVSQKDLMIYAWGEEKEKTISLNAFYQTMFHLRQSLERAGCKNLVLSIPKQGSVINSDYTIEQGSLPLATPSDVNPIKPKHWFPGTILYLIGGFSVLTVLMLITLYMVYGQSKPDAFQDYIKIKRNECTVYLSAAAINDSVDTLLNAARIDCTMKHDIYVTIRKGYMRNTLLACTRNLNNKKICQSVIVMDKKVSTNGSEH